MTVKQLLAALDSRELAEWHGYFRLQAEERQFEDLADGARRGLQELKARRR